MLDDILKKHVNLDIEKLRPDGFYERNLSAKKRDVERIGKLSGWEHWKHCPICNFENYDLEFIDLGIEIRKCKKCFHRYTDRVPVNIEEVYDSEEYKEDVKDLELDQQDYRKSRFGQERAEIIQNLFDSSDKRILDVGCGWGYILNILKGAGFDCYGIELSKDLADFAREKYDLNLASIPIEEYQPGVKFDLIAMFGLIEHIKNPVGVLRHCKRLLNHGGYILMFTPNFESVAVKIQKQDALMIYPGQHLHYFTKRSMEEVCRLIDTTMYSFQTKGIDIGDLYGYLNYKGQDESATFLCKNASMLQAIIDESKAANHMRIILKRD